MQHRFILATLSLACLYACGGTDGLSSTNSALGSGSSSSSGASASNGGHNGPDVAAQRAACSGKASGAACTMTKSDGSTENGTCSNDRDDQTGDALECRGQGGAHDGRGGPGGGGHPDPAAQQAACSGKASGAACSMTESDGTTRNGTCQNDTDDATGAALECRG